MYQIQYLQVIIIRGPYIIGTITWYLNLHLYMKGIHTKYCISPSSQPHIHHTKGFIALISPYHADCIHNILSVC